MSDIETVRDYMEVEAKRINNLYAAMQRRKPEHIADMLNDAIVFGDNEQAQEFIKMMSHMFVLRGYKRFQIVDTIKPI